MKCVTVCSDRIEAEIIKTKLASCGIESLVVSDDEGSMLPALELTQGVGVYVEDDVFDEAIEIVNDNSGLDSKAS